MIVALPLLLSLSAQAARKPAPADEEPTPVWATDEGKDRARLDMVKLLVDAGNTESALALIAKLRSEGMDDPELDYLQGRALHQNGLLEDAVPVLNRIPRRHPIYPSAQNELGMLEMDRKDLQAAETYFKAATTASPKTPTYWNNLGFCLMSAGRPEDAVTALRQSLTLDGSNARTRNNLGFALLAAGHDDEAWRVFRATGGEADARYNLGVGYELKGDLPAAATAYQAALTASPDHIAAREALARVLPEVSGAAPAGASPPPAPPNSPRQESP